MVKLLFVSRLALLSLSLAGPMVFAAIDVHEFPDAATRERYQRLIHELRCPQCLNTNIAGSDAMISRDLRREVHRLLLEGRSDGEILDFMRQRYGDFILYRPRLTAATLLLWAGPFVLLGAGFCILFVVVRGRRGEPPEVSEAERRRLAGLLQDEAGADAGTSGKQP